MISFLGTGLLGANFTRALLKKGEQVQVWNRTPDKAKVLETDGAKAFEQITEAVKGANRIHIIMSDDQAVDEVLNNASPAFEKDVIIIDHTTTSASGAAERAATWKKKGFRYIHAPVFMGPPNALESTGIMLVSGDQDTIKIIEPELARMTGRLLNLGSDPAKAAAIKLLGNLFHIGLTGTISDMTTMAATLDIKSEDISFLLEALNPGVVAQGRLKKITSNTFDQPSWELNMARKDARLMIEQTATKNKQLMVIPGVAKKMDTMLAQGHAKEDWTIISQDPA